MLSRLSFPFNLIPLSGSVRVLCPLLSLFSAEPYLGRELWVLASRAFRDQVTPALMILNIGPPHSLKWGQGSYKTSPRLACCLRTGLPHVSGRTRGCWESCQKPSCTSAIPSHMDVIPHKSSSCQWFVPNLSYMRSHSNTFLLVFTGSQFCFLLILFHF